ncbi:hypothetical protein, partial [Neisseria meningitidis]|uniref:hypothetical protein n=1 Tax=Neisseria meningitidis TaxID=487 RepID=UPI001C5BE9A3
ASKKPTGQCSKHYLVCLSNSVRLKALTLIGNLFFKERLNCFITAVSSAAKRRTIRPQGKTVNAFSGIFLGNVVISLSDKVFYFCQMLHHPQ